MSTTNDDAISVLNDLIETCKDGEQGFREAAEHVPNSDLKTLFNTYSQQRAQYGGELANEVLRRGGEPATSGHVSAAFHRGWLNLKQAVAGKEEVAIIDECERGEDAAKANYEAALKKTIPSDLLSIVQTQYAGVREAHDRIRNMKHAAHSH